MSIDYSRMAATATRLIDKAGQAVTLKIRTPGVIDEVTGEGGDTFADTQAKGVKLNFKAAEIDGTVILVNDFILLVDGEQELTPGDKAVMEGVTFEIINAWPLSPGGTRLITKAQCRT